MPKAAYPTADDLLARFRGANVAEDKLEILEQEGTIEGAVAAAISEWETLTGWTPYLAASSPTTRSFAPAPREALASPWSGSRYQMTLEPALASFTELRVAGQLWTPNVQFRLGPQLTDDKPYQWVQFLTRPSAGPTGTITIRGQWGTRLDVPDAVWNAILQVAQAIVAPDLSFAISGGFTSREVGETKKTFAGGGSRGPLDFQQSLWNERFSRLITNEKRVVF